MRDTLPTKALNNLIFILFLDPSPFAENSRRNEPYTSTIAPAISCRQLYCKLPSDNIRARVNNPFKIILLKYIS